MNMVEVTSGTWYYMCYQFKGGGRWGDRMSPFGENDERTDGYLDQDL